MRIVKLSDEQAGMLLKIFAEATGPFAWAELVSDLRAQLRSPAAADNPEKESENAGN